MITNFPRFLATVCALLAVPNVFAQGNRAAVDAAVTSEIVRQELVGVAIGIIEDGQVAYVAGYGFEDREEKIPVTTETMFRWASISKPLTAITAVQLSVSDRLDLDRDIRELLPEFPDKGSKITTRQLLAISAE